MTNREILEYSKQIISAKSEIDTYQQAAPDLNEQVKKKFEEDSANRARFIDNTLLIGAASKEFRNVFGVDAPHYEISDDCYLAVDRNGDNKYYSSIDNNTYKLNFEDNEILYVKDPMSNKEETACFMDCWQLANAARFDSTMLAKNNFSDNDKKLFVDKQNFFIDSKKDSESSPAHNPLCPPGYDMWAGNKVYSYICKCFDLDELNIYRLIGNTNSSPQTTPQQFEIYADGDHKIEYNIDETGTITKNTFIYKYYRNNEVDEKNEYDDPIIEASQKCMPLSGVNCHGDDLNPIKWYTYRVCDELQPVSGGYKHHLDLDSSPFAKSDLSLVEFELVDQQTMVETSFNKGYAILARNQAQKELSSTERGPGYFDIEYSINIISRESSADNNFDRGDVEIETKQRQFLWWKWEKKKTHKKRYKIVFKPVNSIPPSVKTALMKFIETMENDCIKYYNWLEERDIKNVLPDQSTSKSKMIALRNAAANRDWSATVSALRERVKYDVGVNNISFDDVDPPTYSATAAVIGQSTYIERWESKWVPRWPKWLRRLLKRWSEPVYRDYQRIKITTGTVKSNFLYSRQTEELMARDTYYGPKSGDLTKTLLHPSHMKTPGQLIAALSESEKSAMRAKELLINGDTQIKLNDGTVLNSSTKYEFIVEDNLIKQPSFMSTGIKRANDINKFLKENESLYFNAFTTLSDRINKRTGTLRKTYSLLESTNINAQMICQREHNLAHLNEGMSAYEITGGFGTKKATIKLASFEPETSAYTYLERMGTVYLFADNTVLNKKTDEFEQNFLNTTITDIIDKMSDAQYTYTITEDPVVVPDKTYYVYDDDTGKYRVANSSEKVDDNIASLYEKSIYPSQGPVFTVTLADVIPKSLEGKNPRLVKIF